MAHWFLAATRRALEGDAKRKYFEHAGALLTADGTDDDLIKLEGAPKDYKLVIPPSGVGHPRLLLRGRLMRPQARPPAPAHGPHAWDTEA